MNLHVETVTLENRKQMEALRVFPEQIDFIESVTECLTEADEIRGWKAVGIYDDSALIGFAMYGYFEEQQSDGKVWLDRLLIDKEYQGKGYGQGAVTILLKRLYKEYDCKTIYLSVYDINKLAINLYTKIGFYFNGEYDTKGEKIMVYDFK